MAATVSEKPKTRVTVGAFTIEADHPRIQTLVCQAAPVSLRSRLVASRPIVDAKTGESHIPRDQAAALGQLPEVPGMTMELDPETCTYRVHDPLNDDSDLRALLKKRIESSQLGRVGKSDIRGAKDVSEKLDAHRFKTLVREIKWRLDAGEAKVIKGVAPDMEDIDDLPGNYLLNPGSRVPNSQPRYEKDFEEWIANLHRSGG